jgi:hypothetical protein
MTRAGDLFSSDELAQPVAGEGLPLIIACNLALLRAHLSGARHNEPVIWQDAQEEERSIDSKPLTRANVLETLDQLWELLPLGEVARRLGISSDEMIARIEALAVDYDCL